MVKYANWWGFCCRRRRGCCNFRLKTISFAFFTLVFKVARYNFLTAHELVSKSRDGASFKKSTRKLRATSTTASNSHW